MCHRALTSGGAFAPCHTAVLQEHGGIDSNVIIGDTPELAEPDDGDFEPSDSSNDWGMLTQANVYFTRTRVSELRYV